MDSFRLAAVQRLLLDHYPPRGPGAAFGLIVEGSPVMLASYGCADVHEQTPNTPATLFDLASVSKHFTAYAILLLASRNQLAPDDEIRTYLPELGQLPVDPRPCRIADLLFHSSGLPDYVNDLDTDEYTNFTNARLIDWLSGQPQLLFPTGSRGFFLRDDDTTYCNTNYVLLASIVERISGVSFPHFLKSQIFDPLGMNDTLCDPWQTDHPGQARRHDCGGNLIAEPRLIPTYGDGNVFSTLLDLLRWDRELSRPTLMNPEWMERAWQVGHLDSGEATDYGWGWYVRTWPGRRVAWHGGNWDGARNCFSRWLDDHIGFVLLSNTEQHSASKLVSAIEEIVLER